MAIQENGHDSNTGFVGRTVEWIKKNREYIVPNAFIFGLTGVAVAVGIAWDRIDGIYYAPGRIAEAEQKANAKATATAKSENELKKDYEETGGVNLLRHWESYSVTLRSSAKVVGSDEAFILDRAWLRIKKDSGCDIAETLIIPEIPGARVGDPPIVPKTYSVRLKCNS